MLKTWESGTVEIELDEKAKNLLIKSGIFSYSLGTINPDALRRLPKVPELNVKVKTRAKAEMFTKTIRAMTQVDGFGDVVIGVEDGLCI